MSNVQRPSSGHADLKLVHGVEFSDREIYWRDHQKWLLECGYRLRPRYQPDWTPSWEKSGKPSTLCEDSYFLVYGQIIDAVRIQDGASVALKKISKSLHPYEADIGKFFSTEPLASDPRNMCVPLLETLHPPDDEDTLLLVMPLLRRYDSPRFDTFGEAIHFFSTIFTGLQFMHRHHVAHRDCNSNNIMMEASGMFPRGFHPLMQNQDPSFTGLAKYLTRTQHSPRYYFVDFGIARRYDPVNGPPLELPIEGGDRTVPEFQARNGPCNPFPTDVYYLGNLIRQEFLEHNPLLDGVEGRYGFEFMKPLVDEMVQDDPKKRPNMDEVVARFETIQASLSSWKLRSRVVPRKDMFYHGIIHGAKHWIRRIGFVVKRVPPIPGKST